MQVGSLESIHPHFNYFVFSLPNSKVKFFRGSPSQTPISISKEKCVSDFGSPFSVSSKEANYLTNLAEKEASRQTTP